MIKLRWLPTLALAACMAAILAFGSEGGRLFRASGLEGHWRDVAHVTTFALLGALATLSLSGPRLRGALVAVAACLAFAFVDEWHQGFIAWRSRSFSDVGFDLLGIAIGVSLVSLIGGIHSGREKNSRVSLSSKGESS